MSSVGPASHTHTHTHTHTDIIMLTLGESEDEGGERETRSLGILPAILPPLMVSTIIEKGEKKQWLGVNLDLRFRNVFIVIATCTTKLDSHPFQRKEHITENIKWV